MGLLELQQIRQQRDLPKAKTIYRIPKKSAKTIQREKQFKEAGNDQELDKFFNAMRKRMKGVCLFCGGKTEKDNDETYRSSIAHLLPKRPINQGGFPSVATNESNWIELCHFNNSCHHNFDTGRITWEFIKDSKEWDIIKEKLFDVLPLVAHDERSHKLYSKLENLIYEK